MDYGGIGAIPLGKRGVSAGWDLPKRGTCDNLEKIVAHLSEIRLEVALNVDNESGCNGGE